MLKLNTIKNVEIKEMESKSNTKVRFPISIKLILIFSSLVILVLSVTTYMVSTLVRNDEQIKAEENNHTINGRTAEMIQSLLYVEENNAVGFLNSLLLSESNHSDAVFNDYCKRNQEIICISGPEFLLKINPEYKKKISDLDKKITNWYAGKKSVIEKITGSSNTFSIENVSSISGQAALAIFFPYTLNNVPGCGFVIFDAESIADLVSTGAQNTSFLINEKGDILIHTDFEKTVAAQNIDNLQAVQIFLASDMDNGQGLYLDENGEKCFYAYHKIVSSLYVITSISEKFVFEAIDKTTYRIILFSLAVMFLAIIIIRFFSKSITRPIRTLVGATHEIEKGNFNLDIQSKNHDETGLLTDSVVSMGKGLAERENLITTFRKFTNPVIAERARKGELALGGETRTATIFFSDIRSFTAISEKLSAEQVVSFLNEYMTRMVDCVNKTGGVVDKFIGDAIMAVWGAPETGGTPASDAWAAVKTALMMRSALYEYNKGRGSADKPILKIGCGINTGNIVAGQIGSNDRMEYTVIGDAVNFASRTESLNKPFGTDILVTENTYNLVKDKIIAEEMPAVHVKGKTDAVKIFAVVNMKNIKGPQTLEQVRQILNIATPDLGKVDTDAEEKKYVIGK